MKSEVDLKTIGQQLTEAREGRGWTLEEAAQRTKLKKSFLEHLEKDQFEYFPSISNARGFVRIYARELGLDGWKLLKQFEGGTMVAAETYDLRPEDLEAIPRRRQPLIVKPPRIGVVLFLVIFMIGMAIGAIRLYQIWPSLTGSEDTEPATVEPAEVAPPAEATPQALPAQTPGQATAPKAEPVSADNPPRATAVAPSAEPVETPRAQAVELQQLQLLASRQARRHQLWVRVVGIQNGEQRILYQDLLPAGERVPAEPWEAEQFILKFGEASMVNIIFNGVNEGPYERPGVQEIRIPAE
jgi:cytoskeletal protein RodZ